MTDKELCFDGNYHCGCCDRTFRIADQAEFLKHQENCKELALLLGKEGGKMTDEQVEATYTLNCDRCGECYDSKEGFPSPQLCPKCWQALQQQAEQV